jgi:nucleoid-associated protein YgaU
MQRIERYGVIALVLLLVTVAAVTFWEDRSAGEVTEREQRAGRDLVARVDARSTPAGGAAKRKSTERGRGIGRDLPKTAPGDNRAAQAVEKPTPKPTPVPEPTSEPTPEPAVEPEPFAPPVVHRGEDPTAAVPGSETTPPRKTEADLSPAGGRRGAEDQLAGPAADRVNVITPLLRPDPVEEPPPAPPEDHVPTLAPSGAGSHVVAAGETLSQISAKRLGTCKRWQEIQTLNGITDPSKIFEGMKLRLPQGAAPAVSTSAEPTSAPTSRAPSPGGTYVVRKGDMLSTIAQRKLGRASLWRQIVALNPKVDPDRLLEGTVLRMPEGAPASSSPPASSTVAQATPRSSSKSKTKRNRVR